MSKNQESVYNSDRQKSTKIYICLFSQDENFVDAIQQRLKQDGYKLRIVSEPETALEVLQNQKEKIDCLLVTYDANSRKLLFQLQQLKIIIPVAIAHEEEDCLFTKTVLYHSAEVKFVFAHCARVDSQIDLALSSFLALSPHAALKDITNTSSLTEDKTAHHLLALQQYRLAEKLKERLEYLGVYYKRNSKDFYRNLTQFEREKLEKQLATEYRKIILSYFEDEPNINQSIDRFVNQAFFSDISVSQVLEMHMDLMDKFAQQLKLEGRSEDILLDYRLALIDIIAHLCEMYRRSIPRDESSFDL